MKQFYRLLLAGCLFFAVQFSSAQLAFKVNIVEPSSTWERFAFRPGIGAEVFYQGYWRNSWRFRAGVGVTNYGNRQDQIPVTLYNYQDTRDYTMYPGYRHYQKYRKFEFSSGVDFRLTYTEKTNLYIGMDAVYLRVQEDREEVIESKFRKNYSRRYMDLALKSRIGFEYEMTKQLNLFSELAASVDTWPNWHFYFGVGARYVLHKP